ncbi:MAG: hypothetical protein QM726_01440 [Chitinophagaceae bacterium]
MKTLVPFLSLLLIAFGANAQLINRFTWETSPTTAIYGPNAISVSSYATVSTGGVGGTKGLNPGAGSNDINLVLDGSYFNVPAIDIQVAFRREESQASFFYRGSYFNFGMNGGSLAANFYLTNGSSYTNISSGNVYSVPDDHTFHNYHFQYDNNTGKARMWVDNTLVYTYNGTAGVALYWTGAGNVTVGKDMDATGRNVAVLDNLIIQQQANAVLPLKLISFTAENKNNNAAIEWTTTEEINVASYVVERSSDANNFTAFATVNPSNGYATTNRYQVTDSAAFNTVSYYRLKMINADGSFTYSAVKSVSINKTQASSITAYPNPAVDYVVLKTNNAKAGQYHYAVSTINGVAVLNADVQLNNGVNLVKIDLTKTNAKGLLVITLRSAQNNSAETFTIVRK